MATVFSDNMARLRRSRGLSQREAAAGLGVSQALLSHYENGVREPGLGFVVRVCDYYGVSADELLGRMEFTGGMARCGAQVAAELRALADKVEHMAEDMNR